MASQPLGFVELLAGGVLIMSAITGKSLRDTVSGGITAPSTSSSPAKPASTLGPEGTPAPATPSPTGGTQGSGGLPYGVPGTPLSSRDLALVGALTGA